MSKLEETLRKDGWELTLCNRLKLGDYVAVISGYPGQSEGQVSRIVENDNGTISVLYGECGITRLPADTGALWVAPKDYEHLETRWDTDGTKYINISTKPRKPLFCLASLIELGLISAPRSQVKILDPRKDPETLLKEKPIKVEAHDPRSNDTPTTIEKR